jgi:hypothetical protein
MSLSINPLPLASEGNLGPLGPHSAEPSRGLAPLSLGAWL